MLHHSNVDRLWAYWQAMHPEASTFNGAYQGLARFTTLAGTMVGLDSPLEPFKQANGDWHTSRSVNNIKTFGYTYEGLEFWSKSESEMKQSAVQMINSLYAPGSKPKPKPSATSTSAAPKPTQSSTKQSSQTSSAGAKTQSQSTGSSTKVSVPSSQSTHAASNGTIISQSTAAGSSQSAVATSILPSGTSVALPTVSTGVDSQPDSNTTETGDEKHYYAGITVDVSYLPIRPCSIEVSIDIWRAGGMAIMMMPEKGTVYDSISLTDAMASAGLDQFSGDELLQQIMSRLHVVLRTVCLTHFLYSM